MANMTLNKVILIGNVGKDPEVRYLDKDIVIANFSLATSEKGYTLKNGTEVPEHTEWHNIVTWNNLAKRVEAAVRKGSKLYIEGKIRTRNYEDKKGITRYVTEIYAETMEIISFPKTEEPDSPATEQA
jgi:single-strand DNA-binding protein